MLDAEIRQHRDEAETLAPGDLRKAVEEIVRFAERLLAQLRNFGALAALALSTADID